MRLHLRKIAAEQISLSLEKTDYPSPDWQESEILDAASEDFSEVAAGRLVVIASELLAQVRKADPAYGLAKVER